MNREIWMDIPGYEGYMVSDRGVRLETVAKSLGHSNSKTTAKYYCEVAPETVISEVTSAFAK